MATVMHIADLRSRSSPSSNGYPVMVLGYYAAGKGGGGLFVWDALATLDDDLGTVIRPNSLPAQGRWLRQTQGPMSLFDFGAGLRVGASDDTANVQAAINAALRAATAQSRDTATTEIRAPATAGGYPVSTVTIAPSTSARITIRGDGSASRLQKYGMGTDPIVNLIGTAGTTGCKLVDLAIRGTGKANTGLRAEFSLFDCEDVQITNCSVGLQSVGSLSSCFRRGALAGNTMAFWADSSGWSSNLFTFDGVSITGNDLAGQLDKADSLRWVGCNISGNVACFSIGARISSQANRASLVWDECWWESNGPSLITGSPLWVWLRIHGGAWYTPGGTISIGGNQNRVSLESVHDLARLETTDTSGRVSIRNSVLGSYSIATPHYELANVSTTHDQTAIGPSSS